LFSFVSTANIVLLILENIFQTPETNSSAVQFHRFAERITLYRFENASVKRLPGSRFPLESSILSRSAINH
jgi:hypothetical protein